MKRDNILVGKTITAVYLADDQQAIKFDIEGGEPVVALAYGDCCSHSWIENVENPQALIGSPVLVSEDTSPVGGDESTDEDGWDVIQYYGFKIETLKGTCVIDYRNSSNGYYGGNLVWPGDYYYGGVFGQNNSKMVWRQLA